MQIECGEYEDWCRERGCDSIENIAHGSMMLTNGDGFECHIEMRCLGNGDHEFSDNGNVSFWTLVSDDERMFPRRSYDEMMYWINGVCIGNGAECIDEIYREEGEVRLRMDFEAFARIMLSMEEDGKVSRHEKERGMHAMPPDGLWESDGVEISTSDLAKAHRGLLNRMP